MEFKINEISKSSSFSPNQVLYRINDEIYDEIHYGYNMFYIKRRCGVRDWDPHLQYDIYVTDKKQIIYPLEDYEIYEEYFEYEEILKTQPEITVISIVNGTVVRDQINYDVAPEFIEYVEMYHGNSITMNTNNYDANKESYVYKIKNDYPHEMFKGNMITDKKTNPNVTINGVTTQSSTPSIDNKADFGHIGVKDGNKYRISVAREATLADMNSLTNMWYIAQYNTRNYSDLTALKKLTPEYTSYIEDDLLMNNTIPFHERVEEFELTSYYVVYAKAYVWCDEECTIDIGWYNPWYQGFWVNGTRIMYGGYINGNKAYKVKFKKGRNLIEITSYREINSGGYLLISGTINGVYTSGASISKYDGINFLTYHNKRLFTTTTIDNEDFYFESPIQLKSFGEVHDIYNFSESGSSITKKVNEEVLQIDESSDFRAEEDQDLYSVVSPVEFNDLGSFNFDDIFENIDYVEANGSNWFDTKTLIETENVDFKIEFEHTGDVTQGMSLYGSRNGNSETEYFLGYYNYTNMLKPYTGSYYTDAQRFTIPKNVRQNLICEVKNDQTYKYTIGSTSYTGTFTGSMINQTQNSLCIFKSFSGSPNIANNIRVYGTEIYFDGVLYQKLKPVKRKSDNIVGLFDNDRKIFFLPDGTYQDYVVTTDVLLLSDSFNGEPFDTMTVNRQDAIAYHNGRIYLYAPNKTQEQVESVLTNGIKILYIAPEQEVIQVENPIAVLNNQYENNEEINFLPKADSLTSWRMQDKATIVTEENGEFVIHNELQDGYERYIYLDFNLEQGASYTVSMYQKGYGYCYFYNGGSFTNSFVIYNQNIKTNKFVYSTYTFTAARSNYRIRIGTRSNIDTVVKNLKIIRNDYVPSYITTNTNGIPSNVTLDYTTSFTYSTNIEPIEVENTKSYIVKRPVSGDVWQIQYLNSKKEIIGYSDYLDTDATEAIINISGNTYYINIMDGVNGTQPIKQDNSICVNTVDVSSSAILYANDEKILYSSVNNNIGQTVGCITIKYTSPCWRIYAAAPCMFKNVRYETGDLICGWIYTEWKSKLLFTPIIDEEASQLNSYSVMRYMEEIPELTDISTISYNNGTETVNINLPHILHAGDELVYDEYFDEWIYYPCSYEEDYIIYPQSDFDCILLNGTSHVDVQTPLTITTVINKKAFRELDRPELISLTDAQDSGDNGFGYFEWNEIVGAEEYNIYIDNKLIKTVPNVIDDKSFRIDFTSEHKGYLSIVAVNKHKSSDHSIKWNLLTVPNTPKVKMLDTIYENNRYYVTVQFDVNSDFVDYYNLSYSVDGSSPIIVNLDGNSNPSPTRTFDFVTANIFNDIKIVITADNETGTNNYMIPAYFNTCNDFTKWTYKKTLNQILLAWNDDYDNEDKYLIKYSINNGEWLIAETDRGIGSGTQMLEYLSLARDDEMRVCITPVINGYRQIFSKPIKVSMALDKTLIPPQNFEGTKVNAGFIQFTWDDTYEVPASFELYYRYSDGSSQTVTINNESSGGKFTYVYNVDTYGFVNAKVRMIWELGESDYTDEIVVYNIPVVEEAPIVDHQQRTSGGKSVKITWQTLDFIKKYVLIFTVNGRQQIIDCADPEYVYNIPMDMRTINISASVRAVFIDDSYTNVSTPITFTICNTEFREMQTMYMKVEDDKTFYTTIIGKNLENPYYLYTLSQNSFVKYYTYYEKSYKPYIESEYRLEDNYWGHNVGAYGILGTSISNMIRKDIPLNTVVYSKVSDKYDLHYSIYTNVFSEYKLFSEFTKVVICCLGDSITAGHPNYWAETGTGDETSQYEYWLSRRLKGEYDIINKGYGQEKLVDMVERFDRDITPLRPKYMILHGGTNDWYQDASTKDLETGYAVMDKAKGYVKEIVQKCWDNKIYPIITTLLPRRDITSDGKILWDYFNDWIKEYATEQAILGKDCAYIDFFNAGKDFDPPEPIGDPSDPYKLNPNCDCLIHKQSAVKETLQCMPFNCWDVLRDISTTTQSEMINVNV